MYIVVGIGSSLYLTSVTFMFWRVKRFHSSTETDPRPLTDLGGKSELILKPFKDEAFAYVLPLVSLIFFKHIKLLYLYVSTKLQSLSGVKILKQVDHNCGHARLCCHRTHTLFD